MKLSNNGLEQLLQLSIVLTIEYPDIAVLIAVSSPHRKDAYRANEYAIERIKEIVPIWKKEIWEDGAEWQGHQKAHIKKRREVNNVRVLYFAELKEILNQSSEEIDIKKEMTVQEFEAHLLINIQKLMIKISNCSK